MRNWQAIAVIPLGIVFAISLLLTAHYGSKDDQGAVSNEPAPDFSAYLDTEEKKRAFFEYMLPYIRAANESILAERALLLALSSRLETGSELSQKDLDKVQALAQRYRVENPEIVLEATLEVLLRRIDVIPASLALAQAANESAWGTARFAREGNNYFGTWCWSSDCGMVPEKRDAEKKHEVTYFQTTEDNVRFYMLNLNRHYAYAALRQKRMLLRENGEPITGIELAEGLEPYSERGEAYVDEIQSMIRYNQLQRYSRPTL